MQCGEENKDGGLMGYWAKKTDQKEEEKREKLAALDGPKSYMRELVGNSPVPLTRLKKILY